MLLLALGLAAAFAQSAQPAPPPAATVISGRVVEKSSLAPIAGARILLMRIDGSSRTLPPPPPAEASTDAGGGYAFNAVEPGRYIITIQKAGYAPVLGPEVPRFEVTRGERHLVPDVALDRGGVITGRVLDQAGQPIADVRVIALRKMPIPVGTAFGRSAFASGGPGAQTNDLGEFRLFSLPAGTYYIEASPQRMFGGAVEPAPGTMLAQTFYGDTTDVGTAQPVQISAGQTFGDVTIRIAIVRAFSISGIVIDEAGRPVAGAAVTLMPAGDSDRPLPAVGPFNRLRSDASGAFTISNIAAGAYSLLAAAPVALIAAEAPRGPAGGGISGGSVSMGQAGVIVSTETINGMTTQFRLDPGYGVHVNVDDANLSDVRVIAAPARRQE